MDMFPVRVVVETVKPQHCLTCSHDGIPIADTYAIVSGQTMLSQLVETVLSALGMPQLINDSRGLIQINNWKPLAFETITDNQDELVNNLFKEISSNIVLKILTKQSPDSQNTQCITDLQQKLLKIAIEKQPQILTSLDNQHIKEIIQQVITNEDPPHLNKDEIQAINDWLEAIGQDDSRKSHVSELPKLERWFRTDPNPSRQKLIGYMNILNNAPYRKSNNKVTYQQICNWFSNQRSSSRSRLSSSTNLTVNPTAIFATNLPKHEVHQQAASSSEPTTTVQIPLTTNPIDIQAKFLRANGFASMVERVNESERIDGGSESPTGNDDISEHSNSENGFDQSENKNDSAASSPDHPMDLTPSMVPLPISPKNSLQSANSVSNSAMATIAAAIQSMNNNSLAAQLSHFGLGIGSAPSPSPSLNGVSASNGGSHTPNGSANNSASNSANNASNIARSRLMFDPLSELPILERWFEENPHPGWLQIEQYTEILNSLQYRQNYPPISTHNVKIWFKNRRAKCKRLLTNDGKVAINV